MNCCARPDASENSGAYLFVNPASGVNLPALTRSTQGVT